jgi:branched-subunit amino acid transport protein
MSFSTFEIWLIILVLGVGTFLLRFSFLGLIGSRDLPDWVLRHLRYTAVAILPAIVTPLVLWPSATDGQMDPARLAAAAVALVAGYLTKNAIWAIVLGMGTLYLLGWLT